MDRFLALFEVTGRSAHPQGDYPLPYSYTVLSRDGNLRLMSLMGDDANVGDQVRKHWLTASAVRTHKLPPREQPCYKSSLPKLSYGRLFLRDEKDLEKEMPEC